MLNFFRFTSMIIALPLLVVWNLPCEAYWIGPRPLSVYLSDNAIYISASSAKYDYWQEWMNAGMPTHQLSGNSLGYDYLTLWHFNGPRSSLCIPFAGIVFVTIMLWIGPIRRAVRSRETETDIRCTDCGYDLRGTPERCPECGASAIGNTAARTDGDRFEET